MVRKKSVSSKVKTRKEAYKRQQQIHLRVSRSWRVLVLTIKAVKKFLSFKQKVSSDSSLPKTFENSEADVVTGNYAGFPNNSKKQVEFSNSIELNGEFNDLSIIEDVVEKLVSKVCRRENERKRQLQIRKDKKRSDILSNEVSTSKLSRRSRWLKKKCSHSLLFREKEFQRSRIYYRNKYRNNNEFRAKEKARTNSCISVKYYTNTNFREKMKSQSKTYCFHKYHKDKIFHNKVKEQSNIHILNKYHTNSDFRRKYKANMKNQVLNRYYTDSSIQLKMIRRALISYRNNNTSMRQNSRRLYNQRRRILKKYTVRQSHQFAVIHRNLFMNNLNRFRQIIQEGPDYVCISCRLALFRNQVVPFVEQKYIKQNMSDEIKKRIQTYFNYSSSSQSKWICKLCSDKIKKRQMASRAVVNKLKLCDVPCELQKLNNLEKHLIALRLPFMKIVNLTSGKLSSRLSQKGTKGPLHCVPSDVKDTVTTLPRPVDKSMMVRLQLKRRLKYKAVWEEQLINPNDVRDALFVLTKMHPAYKNIKINEIDENYLTSDQEKNYDNNIELVVEPMDVDTISEENIIEETQVSNENRLKTLALGDIDNTINSDEEIDEDDKDIRTKYNIGTDSCTQPCGFNDFLVFDKEPYVVALAEKNKLSSLLTDKTIEALAFPHLFPDGQGSYDEERETNLQWKEYCKARLFSSDSHFAADSSYIFYLQYLGGAWCLGKVVGWFARIEMQLRGSPHSHMPIWVEGAPKYNGPQTDEKTREEIV
ncbi:unnamed protein product, partial [Rotaria sordida]